MQKTYTLPRHTNLAKQSNRISAFLFDFILGLITYFLLFYLCVYQIYWFSTGYNLSTKMQTYVLDSELCYLKDDGYGNKVISIYDTPDQYEIYEEHVAYYYLNYLTGDVPDGKKCAPNVNEYVRGADTKVMPKDFYTIAWYNYNVLGITEDDPDRELSTLYFTYQKDESGNYDKNKIGIPKTSHFNKEKNTVIPLTREDITNQYKLIYQVAYVHLQNQSFYLDIANTHYFFNTVCSVVCILVSGFIVLVLFPLIFKNGQTLGKKILKIGLANSEGYKFSKKQIPMRIMPFVVISLAMLLPFINSIFVMFAIVAIILLVSFALMMASPKRMCLHDFTARTIVVDLTTSIIFDNQFDEEEFLLKEDNIPKEKITDGDGEEPEISYEK